MSLTNKKIVIVEDETIIAMALHRQLVQLDANVVATVSNATAAIKAIQDLQPDLVLMDINLGDGDNGIAAARRVRQLNIPVVYTTAYSDDHTMRDALSTSPYGYVLKPYSLDTLKTALNLALKRFELERSVAGSEARLQTVTDIAKVGVLELSPNGHLVLSKDSINQDVFDLSGVISREDFAKLINQEIEELDLALDKMQEHRTTICVDIAGESRQSQRWYDVVLRDFSVEDDHVVVGAIQDVTERQIRQKNLIVSDTIINEMTEGVLVLEKGMIVRQFNNAFNKMINVDAETLVGSSISQLLHLDRNSDEDDINLGEKNHLRREVSIKHGRHGNTYILSLSRLSKHVYPLEYVAILTDISKVKEVENKLSELAFKDSLTGVGNRNYLNYLLGLKEEVEHPLTLIFIDLDSFKLINDNYGHDVGDKLLIECAKRIDGQIRASDRLIRLGGDEFIIVNYEREQDNDFLAKRLLDSFVDAFKIGDLSLSVTASIGVAQQCDALSTEELLKHADIAMYKAKQQGKNTFAHFTEESQKEVRYRLYIEQGLRQALKNKEIIVHYQPIMDLDGNLVAVEALARWHSPTIGMIEPSQFIPIAEETNLICPLGEKIFKETCITTKMLNEMTNTPILVHINVSNVQLQSGHFAEELQRIILELGVQPEQIMLEITESVLHSNATRSQIQALRKLGFCIAIDDFGVGYSSIKELAYPFYDLIKLDRSLLPCADEESDNKLQILSTLTSLFRDLNIPVLAEGIETEEHYEIVRDAGCSMLQGFFYSEPMNALELFHFLKAQENYRMAAH